MPLDFNSTSQYRNALLKRNLQAPYGSQETLPSQFTDSSYTYSNPSDFSVTDQPSLDQLGTASLDQQVHKNKYQPNQYETFQSTSVYTLDLTQRGLYPLFNTNQNYNLVDLLTSSAPLQADSQLMQQNTAALRTQFQQRAAQNTILNTVGSFNFLDAILDPIIGTEFLSGTHGLVQPDYRISVDPARLGGANFLDVLSGKESPTPVIPGTYFRRVNDQTSLIGMVKNTIQDIIPPFIRPSETLLLYTGSGVREILFYNLRYSKYRPDYTNITLEAPIGNSYLGSDSILDDVSMYMSDTAGNIVRGPYYLTRAFGEFLGSAPKFGQTIENQGDITGGFTWNSTTIKNPVGKNNPNWSADSSIVEGSFSSNYVFREDSILGRMQMLLDSVPKGGAGRSHVGNIIDQTTRVFQDGDQMISRGAAVKYVDKINGTDAGAEYGRVWTKDNAYYRYSATMKKGGNLRKFTESVVSSPFNLNITPVNGSHNFNGSTNMEKTGNGFRAKKYMFSLENLAWKTSNRYGFRYSDLPECEQGPNGGRVMWFPPYALTVTETNSGKWQDNNFLGRVEPIYTYQGAERTGTISFKVVVDHPSIINLLVRKKFNGMSDAEVNNYAHAFFAGMVDLDLYDLARQYTTLDKDDIQKILAYLNGSQNTTEIFTRYRDVVGQPTTETSPNNNLGIQSFNVAGVTDVYFAPGSPASNSSYDSEYATLAGMQSTIAGELTAGAAATSMSSDLLTNYSSQLTSAFSAASSGNGTLKNLVRDIQAGVKVGNEIDITIHGGCTKYEAADVAAQRCRSLKIYFLNQLGIPYSENDSFDIKYTIDNVEHTTKIKFVAIADGSSFLSDTNGTTCDSAAFDTQTSGNADLQDGLPAMFYCRTAHVEVRQIPANDYKTLGVETLPGATKRVPEQITVTTPPVPVIDEVKRILMKLLSENYYFDALQEESPMVFSSIKEKLKYFHPGFHSTTPEGLNSRLTFLLQCTRPGDTIPIIKFDGEKVYGDARNTTFGPPPICILRIGDFYHSKVVLNDVSINYEESTWDMNPEGIGFQPMIANVSMNFKFIGGQGLKEPVAELQNALSSNFFANTEMYDYRATATENREQFNKEFLHSLLEAQGITSGKDIENKNQAIYGNPIGKFASWDMNASGKTFGTLDYTDLVSTTLSSIDSYYQALVSYYNKVQNKWGKTIASMVFAESNRSRYTGTVLGTDTKIIGLFNGFTVQPDAIVGNIATGLQNLNFDVFSQILNMLTASQLAIYQSNFQSGFQSSFQQDLVTQIKSDVKNGEDSLFTIQKNMVDAIDKINLVDTKFDGIVNADGVKEFTLSASTITVLSQYVTPYNGGIYTLYTDIQSKLVNQSEGTISEDPAYRANMLATYFTPDKLSAYLNLFGDIGSKKSKIQSLLNNYLNGVVDNPVTAPAAIKSQSVKVVVPFTESDSQPHGDILKKIFSSDDGSGGGVSYNYSKMIKP